MTIVTEYSKPLHIQLPRLRVSTKDCGENQSRPTEDAGS